MHGYRFGLSQPVAKFDLVFRCPAGFEVGKIRAWMSEALTPDTAQLEPLVMPAHLASNAAETPGAFRDHLLNRSGAPPESLDYLSCLLITTVILLQDARTPVFARPVISKLQVDAKDSSKCTAEVWLGAIEAVPQDLTQRCVVLANGLLSAVCEHAKDTPALEQAIQTLHTQQLEPLIAEMPGGKSSVPLLRAAFDQGVPFTHIGAGCYLLGWGHRSILLDRSSNSLDSAIGAGLSHRKDVAVHFMRQAGIPVPRGCAMLSGQPIPAAIAQLTRPLVVKPVDRDRGEGVTMNLQDEEDLMAAVKRASSLSGGVLIEEQAIGTCHRILVLQGKVVWAVKRNPRRVKGDGVRTIRQLVDDLNLEIRRCIPSRRASELVLDDLALRCLALVGLNPESVLGAGERAELRPAQSTAWGGDPEPLTAQLHPDNAALAVRVAQLFALSSAGVDVITPDISVPWHQNGAVVNEVNYAPVIGASIDYMRRGAQDYIKTFFSESAIIPIEVYVGKRLSSPAHERHQELVKAGQRAFLCAEPGTTNHLGQQQPEISADDLFGKLRMLQLDGRVETIVVHIDQDTSFVRHGLPFPRLSRLVFTSDKSALTSDQLAVVALLRESLDPAVAAEAA